MKVSDWSNVTQSFSLAAGRWSKALENRGDARSRSSAPEKKPHRTFMMDASWVTGRIAVGGGIWTAENMAQVARAGVTHILDMQIEFDDTSLAEPHGITVLWNPIDDDFQPKTPEVFQRGVDFALQALDEGGTKLLVHCAAGVHRAPMMSLAILCSLGWDLEDAVQMMEKRRPGAGFAGVYVNSVKGFLQVEAGK